MGNLDWLIFMIFRYFFTLFHNRSDTQGDEQKQQSIIREIFKLISKRGEHMCNFLEGGKQWGPDTKIIYRQYATLYFVFWVDSSESELGILDLIHVFVETLDNCFESVCELDIIFNMDKVHYILQEIVMGGVHWSAAKLFD